MRGTLGVQTIAQKSATEQYCTLIADSNFYILSNLAALRPERYKNPEPPKPSTLKDLKTTRGSSTQTSELRAKTAQYRCPSHFRQNAAKLRDLGLMVGSRGPGVQMSPGSQFMLVSIHRETPI